MVNENNPAGRLYKMLNRAREYNKNQPAIEALHEVLDVPKGDHELLYRRLGLFCGLPTRIREEVEAIPNENHALYLKQIPRVEEAFKSLNLQAGFSSFVNNFNETIFYGLEICSDLLSRYRPEKIIKKDDLERIKKEVDELMEEVFKSNLQPNLKQFILRHLRLVALAIQEYMITGTENIEDSLKQTFGSIFYSPETYKQSVKTEEGNKFWQFMGRLAVLTTMVGGLLEIGDKIISFIPEKSDEVEIIEREPLTSLLAFNLDQVSEFTKTPKKKLQIPHET